MCFCLKSIKLYKVTSISNKLLKYQIKHDVWRHYLWGVFFADLCNDRINNSYNDALYVAGTSYGKGSYFSTSSAYSVGYSKDDGDKYIILAKVATGRYRRGSSAVDRRTLSQSSRQVFHSTVDNELAPSIFVVYHDASAYPEYVIKFRV